MYKILIVEDESDIRENIREIFEIAGHEVIEAPNGEEGLKAADMCRPDLILCDIMMPVMDGYELKRKLMENKKCSAIPFIFLTAKADIKSMREGMSLGSDDYIVKPVKAKILIDIIKSRMERISEFKRENSKGALKEAALKDHHKENKLKPEDKIPLYNGKEHLFAAVSSIIVIAAADDYTIVSLNDGRKVMIKKTLRSWEGLLPENIFLRAHRSIIINRNYIEKLEPWFNNTLAAKVTGYPEPVIFSKRYSDKLKKVLKAR